MTDAASSSFEQNRAFWDSRSDEYQAQASGDASSYRPQV